MPLTLPRWRTRAVLALAIAAACGAHAQQVQLRLAGSLCHSLTREAVGTQLVPALSSTADPQASIGNATASRLDAQRAEYFERLDAIQPFSGLFAVAQGDHSASGGPGGRYDFGFEWELLQQGRAEARRQLERVRLEDKTAYLQLERDAAQRQLQENLLAIEQMRNKLLAGLYQREVQAIQPVLQRRRREVAAGNATRSDLAEIEYQAEVAALRSSQYSAARDVLVYPASRDLINQIENVQLRPQEDLLGLAVARSPDYQMQSLMAARTEYLPAVRDNTSLRVYVERNKDLQREPYNLAGVRIRIPIGDDRARDAAVATARNLFEDQKASVRAQLSQQLSLLAERLRLKQTDMRVLQAQNRMLRRQAEVACYRLDHPVASLPVDADRDVEDLSLRVQQLQREILSARLDVLEVLTQVSALVKPRVPEELYSLTRP